MQHLGKMLQVNTTLKSLSLCKHNITDDGAQVLAQRLLSGNRTLECLVLRANHIGATGAVALAALVLRHAALAEFDLSANRIGDAGADAFAQVIEANASHLRLLSLTSTYLTDDGLARVAQACLGAAPSPLRLRSLLLWGNDFGPQASALFQQLYDGLFDEQGVETDFQPFVVDDQVHIAHKETPLLLSPFASPKR